MQYNYGVAIMKMPSTTFIPRLSRSTSTVMNSDLARIESGFLFEYIGGYTYMYSSCNLRSIALCDRLYIAVIFPLGNMYVLRDELYKFCRRNITAYFSTWNSLFL